MIMVRNRLSGYISAWQFSIVWQCRPWARKRRKESKKWVVGWLFQLFLVCKNYWETVVEWERNVQSKIFHWKGTWILEWPARSPISVSESLHGLSIYSHISPSSAKMQSQKIGSHIVTGSPIFLLFLSLLFATKPLCVWWNKFPHICRTILLPIWMF